MKESTKFKLAPLVPFLIFVVLMILVGMCMSSCSCYAPLYYNEHTGKYESLFNFNPNDKIVVYSTSDRVFYKNKYGKIKSIKNGDKIDLRPGAILIEKSEFSYSYR